MKTMYICERCGKTFDTWEEANKCENAHMVPCGTVSEYDCKNVFTYRFKAGATLPESVAVQFAMLDEDGSTVYDENDIVVYEYARYVLDPNSNKKFSNMIADGIKARREETDRWYREYQESKAKEEAQAGATDEK